MQKFENTLWSGKCLIGEMSDRGSLRRGIVQSENCLVGEVSVAEVSIGELSSWETVLQSFNLPQKTILLMQWIVMPQGMLLPG